VDEAIFPDASTASDSVEDAWDVPMNLRKTLEHASKRSEEGEEENSPREALE
jgi:hypothetical protein